MSLALRLLEAGSCGQPHLLNFHVAYALYPYSPWIPPHPVFPHLPFRPMSLHACRPCCPSFLLPIFPTPSSNTHLFASARQHSPHLPFFLPPTSLLLAVSSRACSLVQRECGSSLLSTRAQRGSQVPWLQTDLRWKLSSHFSHPNFTSTLPSYRLLRRPHHPDPTPEAPYPLTHWVSTVLCVIPQAVALFRKCSLDGSPQLSPGMQGSRHQEEPVKIWQLHTVSH